MSEMVVVDEENRDDLSRKAGLFLYSETRMWLENGEVHRADGPAILSPDGVERWYIHGKELTRAVKDFFSAQGWPLRTGLDTPEKQQAFDAQFNA